METRVVSRRIIALRQAKPIAKRTALREPLLISYSLFRFHHTSCITWTAWHIVP